MRRGVILYGPPASGKDTIDGMLREIDPEYVHFSRLKIGPGRSTGYRFATREQLDELRSKGLLVWENHRYGATYAVDMPGLQQVIKTGMPILHLGQAAGVLAVIDRTPMVSWTVAELWCPRPVAMQRLRERDPSDIANRLAAWDDTRRLPGAHIRLNTDVVSPLDGAKQIDSTLRRNG